ncbi:MAG TPA: hypothetical protein VF814_14820 [Casimicrobiaceae bacterium]
MKSPITYALMTGALALAAATPAAMAAAGDEAASASNQSTIDYQAEYKKCAQLPGSNVAGCKDAVGMRAATPDDRTATATEEMDSLQGRDKCAQLSGDAQRECLLNDKAGG